jgi:predicted phospho-2-dehydro-3-deoxyheptonate aldolase
MAKILKRGRTFIVPMDHGITSGPISGIENIDRVIREIMVYVDAVILHKGVAKNSILMQDANIGLIIHLSASSALSSDVNDKRIVTSVENAIKLGGDAVSVHVNVGSRTEARQLTELGHIAEICDEWGIPLLAMMYPRGDKIDERDAEMVRHAVRIGYELGADIIKTNYTGSVDSFIDVVESSPVPVVVAGGSKSDDLKLLQEVKDAILAGAAGAAVGRNIFQHKNPGKMAQALRKIIHGDIRLEDIRGLFYEGNMVAERRK